MSGDGFNVALTAEREQLLDGWPTAGHNEAQWNPSVASDNERFRFDIVGTYDSVDDICTRADAINVDRIAANSRRPSRCAVIYSSR